ncbi:MAG: DUF4332 domain-containing protein [Spirochaetaceae bacterium]
MAYYIDLKKISVAEYKDELKNADLIPSWRILLENIDDNFTSVESINIKNLYELISAIKNKNKIDEFSTLTKIPVNYLTVLRRVINGITQKPNRLIDLPSIDENTVRKLKEHGIKDTLSFYNNSWTKEKRAGLQIKTDIDNEEILKLTKLSDLSRIRWVNHTFAYVLYKAGFDTTQKVSDADYKIMYKKLIKLNKDNRYYKGHIGEKDMKTCIEFAKKVDLEVEY